MAGHAVALVEAFHPLGTETHSAWLLEQRVGHGGGVAFDFHMGIDSDPGLLPCGRGIRRHRQRSERWALAGVKQRLACARQLLAGAGIARPQEGMEGRMDLASAKKG